MKLYCVALIVALSSPGVSQILVAPEPIELRLDQADVVCVCSVIHSDEMVNAANLNRQSRPYSIVVVRAYKGIQDGESITAASAEAQITLTTGIRYVLMLQRRSRTSQPLITDALPVPGDFPRNTAPTVSRSLEGDIDTYLISETGSGPKANIYSALELLNQYKELSSRSEEILSGLSAADNNGIALLSTSMLLMRDFNVSRFLPIYLSKLASITQEEHRDLGDVSFILMHDATRSDIAQLERLASSGNREIQHAALRALRKIADPSTTTFLISELDAPDSESQYIAMITLAEIYHKTGDYGPGIGEFEKNKEKYILLWKRWYRESHS